MSTNILTHCDIGVSPKMAAVIAKRPTIEYLCDLYDGGDSIRLGLSDIKESGRLPAAVSCPLCITIAELIYRGVTLEKARRQAKVSRGFDASQVFMRFYPGETNHPAGD